MDLGLKDKVAVVTAASKGLGRASATALAAEGAKVFISSRGDSIFSVADEIKSATGAEVLATQADMTNPADIDAMLAKAKEAFGRIDILVINAGGPRPGNFLDVSVDDWEQAVQLTLMSAVRLCYGVIPEMLAQKSGSIVAIESVSVKQPVNNLILSNSIRLAVIGLLKSISNEFASQGIRVNSVNPTFTWTDRVKNLLAFQAEKDGSTIEELKEKMGQQLPIGRIGSAEEFGRTVAWIASPAASFITGHALMFDGGAVKSPL